MNNMNSTKNYNSKNNKYKLTMDNKITFHKPKYNELTENDVTQIKNIFPEFSNKVIKEVLRQNNFNKEKTIDYLLSKRYIQQTLSENDIKRNSKILEIYNSETNNNQQGIIYNNDINCINNMTNININVNKEVERNFPFNNEYYIKRKNKKKLPNTTENSKNQENNTIPGQTYKITDSSSSSSSKNNKNKKRNQPKNSQNQNQSSDESNSSNDNQSNDSIPNIQNYFKISEVKNIFPNISDRLLILTLQVNHGNVEKVVDFLLMQNTIKDEINEEDLCRSLELQIENEQGLPTSCDGNCINQGYPCILHSHLFITKDDEYNTLNLSEIMKIWNQYELRDHNANVGFIDNNQAIKYYTQDNDEIEFLILNRIKEAELAMTPEERKHENDVKFFRDRENELKQLEHSFFAEASKKYKAGGITGFSSAAYYSQEGRQLQEEIEKVKLLAISAQIKTNERNYMKNNGLSSFCGVDLHGLQVKEALPYLSDMLAIWKIEVMKNNPKYNKERSKKAINSAINTTTETYDFKANGVKSFSKIVSSNPKPKEEPLHNLKISKVETLKRKKVRRNYPSVFNIITGKGLHSDANIGARLRPVITNYLKKNKFNFVESNPGSFEVRL